MGVLSIGGLPVGRGPVSGVGFVRVGFVVGVFYGGWAGLFGLDFLAIGRGASSVVRCVVSGFSFPDSYRERCMVVSGDSAGIAFLGDALEEKNVLKG